jgi:preprotein translocase subunit YajC
VTLASLNLMATNGPTPGWFLPLQIILIVGIFYFLIIRPQGQARKKHEELLNGLQNGNNVMTAGGIIGKVKKIEEIKDKNEVHVTIETGGSTVVVERSRIIRVNDVAAPMR